MEYRKDEKPERTISKITNILQGMNIDYRITNEKSYKNLWWSLKVEVCDYPNISANGKGCTRSLALASGLAEFMERLQSGFLFDDIRPNEKTDYLNILTQEYLSFSNELLKIMCGTNGLASGNSFSEAVCQGFFEVLERHVLELIYMDSQKVKKGFFDKELFVNTEAYAMILEIEKKGLQTYIIDGTCDGKFPVIGLIVLNPKSHSYLLNMASDFDLNICLKRCISELYQGRTLDSLLDNNANLSLNPVFGNLVDYDEKLEFFKQITISHGALSIENLYQFLMCKANKTNLKVFREFKSNNECYQYLKEYCHTMGINVYVGDLSCTDFYTCRVYVPQYSEVFERNLIVAKNMMQSIGNVRSTITQYIEKTADVETLKEDLLELLPYKIYTYQFPLYKFFPKGWSLHQELYTDDIMRILSIISLYQKNIDDAIMYAKKSNDINNPQHMNFILWYLKIKKSMKENPVEYWYEENNGINYCIKELEEIYNNSAELFIKQGKG